LRRKRTESPKGREKREKSRERERAESLREKERSREIEIEIGRTGESLLGRGTNEKIEE
jgi:hypothetical protein